MILGLYEPHLPVSNLHPSIIKAYRFSSELRSSSKQCEMTLID